MKRTAVWFAALCVLACASCSDPKPTNLLVMGNSITYNPPNPPKGWNGNWGMAAPSEADDFAHLSASALNIPLTVMTLFVETDPQSTIAQIPGIAKQVGSGTAVVLEFGDDVPSGGLNAFAQAYDQVAAAVSKGNSLVCVSTWWEKPEVDNVIAASCGAHGGRYTFIGDLYTDPDNTDLQTVQYANPRINSHPRKWGHRHIAGRVFFSIMQSR